MAGRDASANLGGMLSQIGGAFAGAGQSVGQGLMRPITMAFRPQLDPNSVESLQRQAAFQGRIGDTEQARLFTGQALALEERNREEAEKQRKLREGQAQAKAINAYTNALASGDEAAIEAAQAEAMSVGYAQGVNMMPLLTQAEERFRSKKNQAFAETERVRLAKERAENLAVDKATQAMSAAFNKATTEEELEGLLQSAGPLVAQQASILYNNNISRLEANRARAEREAERNALFETIDVNLIPSDDSISPAKSNELRAAVDSLNKSIEGFNSKVAGKKLIPQSERRNLDAARNNLLQRIYGLTDQVGLIDYRAERDRKQQLQTAVNRVLVDDFSEAERKEAMVVPGPFNDLTEAQAIRLLRNRQLKALLGVENAAAYVQYEEGDPEYVKAGLSTDQPSAALPQSAIDDGVTEAEWSAMTPGERALYD